jgi:predicted Mrr-cat superfamily restriction endonuclease
MTDDAEKPEQQQVRKGLSVDMPGFEGEVSEETAKSFMQHTGASWRWVVKALAFAVFWCGFCWGLSWLI